MGFPELVDITAAIPEAGLVHHEQSKGPHGAPTTS
jgi:hypothetical protein